MPKIDVAILGATGAVGQRFIQLLADHPWFRVAELVGKSSAGKKYGDAVNWVLESSPPAHVIGLTVKSMSEKLTSPLVFSALPKEAARDKEPELAAAGHIVCTNASAHRMGADIPLLLPEVNYQHTALIEVQRQKRGWSGALIANANCTTMPVAMALAPLRPFGIEKIHMVSEQAVSGAGYPGVASLDILDNIVPYVSGDETKMETETLKILGEFDGTEIQFYESVASATCTRVPVIDGHLVNMSVSLRDKPSLDAILEAWAGFDLPDDLQGLPSAPPTPLQYLPQVDRPQPRRDRHAGRGMMISLGRLRECPILGYKFATLGHNTIRGAAGCSILNAEYLATCGFIPGFDANNL